MSPRITWLSGLVAAVLLGACAAPSSDDGAEASLEQSESEATGVTPAWYRVRNEEGALALEPVAGGTMTCANGEAAARCQVAFVDVKRAGIEAGDEARARIATLAQEDGVMVLGRAYVRTTGQGEERTKTLRLLASRVYENVARASTDGDLYEVTRLEAPAPCTLARSMPSPRGALAQPIVETFDGSCAHRAKKLTSTDSFVIDEPNWESARPAGPAKELADGVTTDLSQGDAVVVVGRWLSSDGPISRPRPQQVWRDMKHLL